MLVVVHSSHFFSYKTTFKAEKTNIHNASRASCWNNQCIYTLVCTEYTALFSRGILQPLVQSIPWFLLCVRREGRPIYARDGLQSGLQICHRQQMSVRSFQWNAITLNNPASGTVKIHDIHTTSLTSRTLCSSEHWDDPRGEAGEDINLSHLLEISYFNSSGQVVSASTVMKDKTE